MTLNYWMMVERYPNLKEEVGGSIPDYEISSLLDRNLALACRPSISKQNKTKQKHWNNIAMCNFEEQVILNALNGAVHQIPVFTQTRFDSLTTMYCMCVSCSLFTIPFTVCSVTHYLELCCAMNCYFFFFFFTVYLVLYHKKSNGLFGCYITLSSLTW